MLVFELKGNFEQFGYKFRYKFITKPFNAFSLILAKWHAARSMTAALVSS